MVTPRTALLWPNEGINSHQKICCCLFQDVHLIMICCVHTHCAAVDVLELWDLHTIAKFRADVHFQHVLTCLNFEICSDSAPLQILGQMSFPIFYYPASNLQTISSSTKLASYSKRLEKRDQSFLAILCAAYPKLLHEFMKSLFHSKK